MLIKRVIPVLLTDSRGSLVKTRKFKDPVYVGDPFNAVNIFNALAQATNQGLAASIHDCSDGGLAAAVAEMAFSGELGATVELNRVHYSGEGREDKILFSESNSRFLVEVSPQNQRRFEKILEKISYSVIGRVEAELFLKISDLKNQTCVDSSIWDLKESWQKPLRW